MKYPIPIDIDYDSIWFVVGKLSDQISGQGLKILQDKLDSEGLVMTSDLKRSLFRAVKQNNAAWLTEVAMQFEAHGRYKDMKYMHYNKWPDMRELAHRIVEGKSSSGAPISNWKRLQFLSGYKPHGALPTDKEYLKKRLSWVLARARMREPIVMRKGKGWYIKNYMKEIYGELEDHITVAAAQAALNTMKKALQNK